MKLKKEKLEAVIGLEIHVQLRTRSKMFCGCANLSGEEAPPNIAVCPVCLGYPGALPVPNEKAVLLAAKVGLALGGLVAARARFDRKSYFYPDLPKGYQISQYFAPLTEGGEMHVLAEGIDRHVRFVRVHLEEDVAKNIHTSAGVEVDFNRAGIPLLEMVTEPDLRSPQEARLFLQQLRNLMRYLHVSHADMEKGQLRVDANISLRPRGERKRLFAKTEIKNLNSFKAVHDALQYEIERQQSLWRQGKPPRKSSTRGWDAKRGKTTAQREKEMAADYRYFPEPDLPPLLIAAAQRKKLKRALPELPHEKKMRFMRQYGLREQAAQIFADEPSLARFYEKVITELRTWLIASGEKIKEKLGEISRQAAAVILDELRAVLAGRGKNIDASELTAENCAELLKMLWRGEINRNVVKEILAEMVVRPRSPAQIVEERGLRQEQDEGVLHRLAREVMAEHAEVVEKIKAGKQGAIQFLVGQVMARTRGRANAQRVQILLRKLLREKN